MDAGGRHLRSGGSFAWSKTAASRSMSVPRGRWALAALLLGIVLLTMFVIGVSVVSSRSDRLRSSGGQTAGRIVTMTPDNGKSEGSARVAYRVGGHVFEEHVDLGADAEMYRVSQQVRVFYDRDDPTLMTIDDEDNQSGPSVYVMIFALVLGVFALGTSAWQGMLWAVGLARGRRRPSQ